MHIFPAAIGADNVAVVFQFQKHQRMSQRAAVAAYLFGLGVENVFVNLRSWFHTYIASWLAAFAYPQNYRFFHFFQA